MQPPDRRTKSLHSQVPTSRSRWWKESGGSRTGGPSVSAGQLLWEVENNQCAARGSTRVGITPAERQKQALRITMTTCNFLSERAPVLIPQLLLNLSWHSPQSLGLNHGAGFPRLTHSPFPWSTHFYSPVMVYLDCFGGLFDHIPCIMFPTQEGAQGTRAGHITSTTQEARGIRAPHIVNTAQETRRNRAPYHVQTHFQVPSWFQQRRLFVSGHSRLGSTFQLVIVSLDFLWILTCTFLRILFSSLPHRKYHFSDCTSRTALTRPASISHSTFLPFLMRCDDFLGCRSYG